MIKLNPNLELVVLCNKGRVFDFINLIGKKNKYKKFLRTTKQQN